MELCGRLGSCCRTDGDCGRTEALPLRRICGGGGARASAPAAAITDKICRRSSSVSSSKPGGMTRSLKKQLQTST